MRKLQGNVTALPVNAGTRVLANAAERHAPAGVPAKGAEMLTRVAVPSGANVTVARPLPPGPPARLQLVARAAAEPNCAIAAPRLNEAAAPAALGLGAVGGACSSSVMPSGRTRWGSGAGALRSTGAALREPRAPRASG